MNEQTLTILLAIVIGCWEVIARVIPSVNNWSGTGIVLRILNFISELLNRKKEKGK